MTIRTLAPAIAIGLSLAGCMGSGPSNRGVESIHQPVVSVANYVFDADVSSGAMSPSEVRRVSDWLDAMGVSYGDRIAVDDTSSGGARAARSAVAALVGRRGLLLDEHAPITSGQIAPGRVRIVITRASARVPGCPDWRTVSATDYNLGTTSNYGCGVNSNLAAMVANPQDLVRGQTRSGNDPLTASRAIEAYRNAPPTGTNGLSNTGTGGSGGGK